MHVHALHVTFPTRRSDPYSPSPSRLYTGTKKRVESVKTLTHVSDFNVQQVNKNILYTRKLMAYKAMVV